MRRDQLATNIKKACESLKPSQTFSITTFKNDRGFKVTKLGKAYRVIEFGHHPKTVTFKTIPDTVKGIVKLAPEEFPTSKQLRLHV